MKSIIQPEEGWWRVALRGNICDKSRNAEVASTMRAGSIGELTANLVTDPVVRNAVSEP